MTELVKMECPSCGGALEHRGGRVWICPYCDKECLTSTKRSNSTVSNPGSNNGTNSIALEVSYKGRTRHFEVTGDVVISGAFRRRTTAADPYPMDLVLEISGRKVTVAEEIVNIGRGSLTLSFSNGMSSYYADGTIQFSVDGIMASDGDLGDGSRIDIGSVVIDIEM